jgi:MSHA biogenesis protein MshP
MKNIVYRVKGFMLPMAIFLLVTLAALVAYAMRLAMLANMGTIQDVQGAQAYLAARAGVEWAAFQVLIPAGMQACPVQPTPFTVNGFNVALVCNRTITQDKGNTQDINIYTITSTASVGVAGSQDYIERRITVTLSRCIYNNPNGEECN